MRLPDHGFRVVRFERVGGEPGKPAQHLHCGQPLPPVLGFVVDEPGQGLGVGAALLGQPPVEGPGGDPDVGGFVVQAPGDRDLSVQNGCQIGPVTADVRLNVSEGRERGIEFQQPRQPFAAGPHGRQPHQDRAVDGAWVVGSDGPAQDAGDLRQVVAVAAQQHGQAVHLVVLAPVGLGPEGLREPRSQGFRGGGRDGQEQFPAHAQDPAGGQDRRGGAGTGQPGQQLHLFLDRLTLLGPVDQQPPERALEVHEGGGGDVAGVGQYARQFLQAFDGDQVEGPAAGHRESRGRRVPHRVLFTCQGLDAGERDHHLPRVAAAQRGCEDRTPGGPAFVGVAGVQAGFGDGDGVAEGQAGGQPQLIAPALVGGQRRHPGGLGLPQLPGQGVEQFLAPFPVAQFDTLVGVAEGQGPFPGRQAPQEGGHPAVVVAFGAQD